MKRVFDIICASLGLVVLSPVLLITAVLIRRDFGAPLLLQQMCPGHDGQPFEMLKFRTMPDSCSLDGRSLADANLLTQFGRKLRSLSIDELPELWNVLKGEMSLVGPRPLLMEYLPC